MEPKIAQIGSKSMKLWAQEVCCTFTTTKYSFANAGTASGKVGFASEKDFPTHFSASAACWQLCVAKSIADAILTVSVDPYTITNALQRRSMHRQRDVHRQKSNLPYLKVIFANAVPASAK